jgi:hypothetical protein
MKVGDDLDCARHLSAVVEYPRGEMGSLLARGLLGKAAETVRGVVGNRPSLRRLRANRTQRFDRLHAIVPSTVEPGEPVSVTLQARGQCERFCPGFGGSFRVESTDDATHPGRVTFPPENGGVATVPGIELATPGVQYLTFTDDETDRRFVSNPVRVVDDPDYRLYWGDLHLHSRYSDGCGDVADGLRFGRDVMDLDVVAYTDHDTMGFFIPPRLQRRRMRRRYVEATKDAVREYHDPGSFVTLFAYEWTKQPTVGGHLNVYFDSVDEAELFDSISPESNTYEKLWERLREFNASHDAEALTVPHHPAESTYPFDFSAVDYDDDLAPLVEVYSQWGSSERPASAGNHQPVLMGAGEVDEPGHYVQDALEMGYRVGMTASSDYHGPHPGHSLIHTDPHLPTLVEVRDQGLGWGLIWRVWNEPSYPGGLQAFYAPELTRESIFESLRSRRVYGTSQPHRILVDFRIEGVRVGEQDSTVTVESRKSPRTVSLSVAGTAPVTDATVVKNNEPWRRAGHDDDSESFDAYTVERSWIDERPLTGMSWGDERTSEADVYYVRVRQADGGMAWAGPVWVERSG